jgi:hypothetical protein
VCAASKQQDSERLNLSKRPELHMSSAAVLKKPGLQIRRVNLNISKSQADVINQRGSYSSRPEAPYRTVRFEIRWPTVWGGHSCPPLLVLFFYF